VRQASEALRLAAPGETRALPGSSLASGSLQDGTASPLAASPFLNGATATIHEHRNGLCALFVQIRGLDESAPGAEASHQAVVTSLHAAIRPFTASSGTLLVSDKGLVFTVCLGMPLDTHADDPLRAVRAGLAIRADLARQGHECAIGVASGFGVSLDVRASSGRLYWAVGQAMHLADRLMQAAGDGILCTDRVAAEVRHAAILSPEAPMRVKGLAYPLRSFRVLGGAAVEERPERLYGREAEQRALDDHLGGLDAGRGAVLWMVGAAGLGKTALVHYLREAAAGRHAHVYRGGAASADVAAAYGAWRPVFASLLSAPPEGWADALPHPQFAPLLNAVTPGLLPETPTVSGLSGQARADATLRVLGEAVATLAGERVVVVLEDCHWMDLSSWRLVLRVAQDLPGALIVLTSRPIPETPELSALRRLAHFTELKLTPLPDDAIAAIVEHVLGGDPASEGLLSEITERSYGFPLYAREHALMLASQPWRLNLIAPEPVAASLEADRPLPPSVESAIVSRLDTLSVDEHDVLNVASVINDAFSVELLAATCPAARGGDVKEYLAALLDRQLLEHRGADDRFAFQHAVVRDVIYRKLAGDQRAALHRRVAEAMERTYADDLRPYFATLAHHWNHANAAAKTIDYADQAATQALAAGAFDEARELLALCIRKSTETGDAVAPALSVRLHCQLADALQGLGRLEERRDAAHEALRRAGRHRAHGKTWLALQAIGSLQTILGRVLIRRLRNGTTEECLELARAYRHSAEVCYFDNDAIGMFCDDLSAVACAWLPTPSTVFVGAATELGGIVSVGAVRWMGEWMIDRAIAAAEEAQGRSARAYAHMIKGLYYIGKGEWGLAEESVRACQEICEPLDDRVNWTNAQAVRFWMSHHRNQPDAAFNAACHLRDRASETGNSQHQAWALRCLAVCALRQHEWEQARVHAQAAFDTLAHTAVLNEKIPTVGLLALAQLRAGDAAAARAKVWEVVPLLERVKRPIAHGSLEGYAGLSTVALDGWTQNPARWQAAVEGCLALLDRYRQNFAIGEPRYRLHRGDYARAKGAIDEARAHYIAGERIAAALGMEWEEDRCREARLRITPAAS
jgi:hypothetical protein